MDTEAFRLVSLSFYADYSFWELLRFWEIESSVGTYPIFLALLYHAFGLGDVLIGLLVNFLAYGYAMIFINRTRKLIVSLDKLGEAIFYLIIFTYPLGFFYSVILLRESLFILACAASMYFLVSTWCRPSYKFPIVSFLALNGVVSILHAGNLLFFAVVSVLVAIRQIKTNPVSSLPIILVMTVLVIGILTLVQQGYFGGYFTQYATTGDPLEKYLANMQQANLHSIARYAKPYSGNLFEDATINFSKDLFQFLFTPYVFPPTNLINSSIPRFFSSAYVTIILLGTVVFALRRNHGIARILLLVLLVSVFLYVLGSIDYFQAGRHRTKFFPIVAVLSAYVIFMAQHWFSSTSRSEILRIA
jgi:hypothetical protein